MGRLLVGGAEVDFRGIGRRGRWAVLKSVFPMNLIDRILKPMQGWSRRRSSTAKEGHDKGELRIGPASSERQIDRRRTVSGHVVSRIRSLELRLKNLYNALAVQLAAKRHQAYLFNQALKEANRALEDTPQEELDRLSHLLRDLRRLDGEILQSELDLANRRAESQHFDWIEQAAGLWQQRPADEGRTPGSSGQARIVHRRGAGCALRSSVQRQSHRCRPGGGASGLAPEMTTAVRRQVDRSELAGGFASDLGNRSPIWHS
jgi:hypothetical protein